MIKATFVIPFKSNRMDNLFQTIRFLERNESKLLLNCELLLVCQDNIGQISSKFSYTRVLNLNIDEYLRSFMLNTGSYHAKGDILIILDSDRILPKDYFYNAINLMSPKTIISAKHILKFNIPYSDYAIENGDVEGNLELRASIPSMHTKNIMSGNTVMMRADYHEVGWMDESFKGYGYSDTDFAMTLHRANFHFHFTNIVEYHLWHSYDQSYSSSNLYNAIKYCNKWNIPIDSQTSESLRNVNPLLL